MVASHVPVLAGHPLSLGLPVRSRHFVGRTEELAVLEQAVARATAGQPQVVCVQGAAGIGKSALLRELVERCELQVLEATASEDEAGLPFAFIDQLLCHQPNGTAGTVEGLGSPGAGWSDPVAAGAHLLSVLGAIPGDGPIGLLVDDLHWVDEASAQAIAFMLRRLGHDRVIALFAARDDQGPLPGGLVRLFAAERGTVLTLSGLRRSQLRQLADALGVGDVPTRVLACIQEMTTGNPLHATALLEELDLEVLAGGADPLLRAPRSYARLVSARLARCDPDTERLVAAASVLGARCLLAHAARVAGLAHPLGAVEEAVRRQLLTVRELRTGAELGFYHPLVRSAVYHDLGIVRRAALHEAAAGVVDGEAARLLHRAAARQGDDGGLTVELTAFASRALGSGTPVAAATAAAAFEAAARLAPSRDEREQHLLSALECRLAAGDAGAATLLAAATGEFAPSARLGYLQGVLALLTGRVDEAEDTLQQAWERSHTGDPAIAGGIAAQLATIHLRRANAGEIIHWAQRAIDAPPAPLTLGLSPRMVMAVGLGTAGRLGEALASIPALDHGPTRGVDPSRLDLLVSRGIVRLWNDDPVGAREDLATTIRTSKQCGAFTPALFASLYLAEAEFRLGEWDEAVMHGEFAVSMTEDAEQFGTLVLARGNAALPLACRGDWVAAERHVDTAMQAVAAMPDPTNITWAYTARAVLAAARGDHATVVDAARTIADALHDGGDEPGIKPWRVLGAEALAALGDPDGADRLLRRVEARAAAGQLRHVGAVAERARALIEMAAGRPDSAEDHFRAALARVEPLPIPFEGALTRLAYGKFLRRRGQRRHAATLLSAAHATFVHLGAAPFAATTERELGACGLTPGPRDDAGRWQLTPQELAVAHQTARGLRNREVAAELVISVKTVEYHLANVYRKLAIHNRSQLTALLLDEIGTRERVGATPTGTTVAGKRP